VNRLRHENEDAFAQQLESVISLKDEIVGKLAEMLELAKEI
jgi:hypothetical protein